MRERYIKELEGMAAAQADVTSRLVAKLQRDTQHLERVAVVALALGLVCGWLLRAYSII